MKGYTWERFVEELKGDKAQPAIIKLFSNPSILGHSFMKQDQKAKGEIDPEIITKLTSTLLSSHPHLIKTLKIAQKDLLTVLAEDQIWDDPFEEPKVTPWREAGIMSNCYIAVILQTCQMLKMDWKTVESLCGHLANLEEDVLMDLESKIFAMESGYIRMILKLFQSIISIRIKESSGYIKPLVRQAIKFVKILNEANKRYRGPLQLEDFYNQTASDGSIDLNKHYFIWVCTMEEPKKWLNQFTLCSYPFLLDTRAKKKIIEYDAFITQSRYFEQSVRLSYFSMIPPNPYLVLCVRRSHILEDSVLQLTSRKVDLKKTMRVVFYGEEGVDAGGVTKEFFHLIIKELLNPDRGLFIWDETHKCHWFPRKRVSSRWEYSVAGAIIGLAIYNRVVLDVRFPYAMYAHLLGYKQTLSDLRKSFPETYKGLHTLLTMHEDVKNLGLTFEVTTTGIGEDSKDIPLIPGGENIVVTSENRKRYVEIYADWVLNKSVEASVIAFRKGFYDVCGEMGETKASVFRLLAPQELQRLICGSETIDFANLEPSVRYVGFDTLTSNATGKREQKESGSADVHPVIKNFWKLYGTLTYIQKKKLLAFITGSDRIPIGGVKDLNMVIQSGGENVLNLPSAHTCFHTLILPNYKTYELLKTKLFIAIEHSQGFGLQ
ncbi:hypothetical protein AAMO2058_000275500 [Amorphochlora amoebiformis]